MFRRILVGYLDTEQGHEALALGQALAHATGAELVIATSGRDEDLARLAHSYRSDLIVLGPTHRGALSRVVPGTTVEHLLDAAPCPVAVAPAGFEDAETRVVGVGYDASGSAQAAREIAAAVAAPFDAELRVFAVSPANFAAELVEAAEAGVDLLVICCPESGLPQGVAGEVMQRTACPLLIAPAGVTAPQPVGA